MPDILDKVTFARDLDLSEDEKDDVLAWPFLRQQLEQREKNGFDLRKLEIKSVAWFGPRVGFLFARVEHDPLVKGKPQNYHAAVMPQAASLLMVFRDCGKTITSRVPTIENHHAVLVSQARFAHGRNNVLEIPSGMIKWGEKPQMGAGREAREEIGHDFPGIKFSRVSRLGSPFGPHPNLTEIQHPFYLEVDVTSAELKNLKRSFPRSAGLAEETEATRPMLVSLPRAYRILEKSSPMGFLSICRYMKSRGLLVLAE